jgi:predicted HTH domain antitoxin
VDEVRLHEYDFVFILVKKYFMAVVISDDILKRIELTGSELVIELACYLYQKKRLSTGKARELAQLSHMDFQKELAKRDISIHYDQDDLDLDMKNLGIDFS